MLAADKDLIESNLRKQAIVMQNKELEFYVSASSSMATQAALLAGFSYSAMLNTDFEGIMSQYTICRFAFYFTTGAAFGSEFCALILGMMMNVLGPRLALQGPAGSMHRAVRGMARMLQWTSRFFIVGMLCFHASGITYVWLAYEHAFSAFCISLLLVGFVAVTILLYQVANDYFALEQKDMVSGAFSSKFVQRLQNTVIGDEQDTSNTAASGNNLSSGYSYSSIV